jgi:hypothetical protein
MLHRQKKVDEPKRRCLYTQATAMADANVLTACLIHLAKHGDIELSRMQGESAKQHKLHQATENFWDSHTPFLSWFSGSQSGIQDGTSPPNKKNHPP